MYCWYCCCRCFSEPLLDNPINGYKDYGVAYGFCVTALDTGIDRPINYSRDRINKLKSRISDALSEKEEKENTENSREPNIIFIQLESFFDLTQVNSIFPSASGADHFRQTDGAGVRRGDHQYGV